MIHGQIMHYWITHKRNIHRIHELPSPLPIEGQPRRARALAHVPAASGRLACTAPSRLTGRLRRAWPPRLGVEAPRAGNQRFACTRRAASPGAWSPRLGVEAPRAGDQRFACAAPSRLTGRLATAPPREAPRAEGQRLASATPSHLTMRLHSHTRPQHLRLDACGRRPERLREGERETGVHAAVCGIEKIRPGCVRV
ncbi:hypothetical protein C2845_PM17G03950 [Panicum miliaceum]|uniref:Uncharacterized protein n=1 Tax=Panicum miliaceum TaxID=4540 RepID=A0A3L6Q2W0_PANMI|nr:hypothetical protein C2845_PM17G03950 [Panicum miliaceum]